MKPGFEGYEADRARFMAALSFKWAFFTNAADFRNQYKDGRVVIDSPQGIVIGTTKLREIVPIHSRIETTQLSHTLRKQIRRETYTVSTDCCFHEVMCHCALPRKEDQSGGHWLSKKIQDCLGELHLSGHAHSLEVWSGETLVAGLLALQLGSTCIGLSSFYKKGTNGAGNFAYLELHARLVDAEYELFDAINPSPNSRLLGGRLEDAANVEERRKQGIGKQKDFPKDAVLLKAKKAPWRPAPQGNILQCGRNVA